MPYLKVEGVIMGKLITLGEVPIDEAKDLNEKSEIIALNRLKNLLKDTSSVLYYRPKIYYRDGVEVNPDILWIHPMAGIVVIEVKAWDYEYLKGASINGGKKIITKDGNSWKNPIYQSDEHKNAILNKLKAECGGEVPLPVSNMVMFPNMTHAEYSKLNFIFRHHIPKHKCIFKNDRKEDTLSKLGNSVSNIFIVDNVSLEKFDLIRKILFPELTIGKEMLNATVDDMVIMDTIQEKLLRGTYKGRKILRGAPGSGKTVVLVGKAIQEKLYYPHKKIILITYVRVLAEEMRQMIKNIIEARDLNISVDDFEIDTIHSLASKLLKENNVKVIDCDIADAAAQYVMNNKISRKYDVILCDEVQDFKKEWFNIISALEKPDSITIFGVDETQRIYEGREWRWKDLGIDARGRMVHVLRKSYRATDKVMKLAVEFIKRDSALFRELKELDIDLDSIDSVRLSDDNIKMFVGNEFEHVSNIVKELIKEGYSPGDIYIVNPYQKSLEYYKNRLKYIVGEHNIHVVSSNSDKQSKLAPKDKLLITTYHSVKGLENKIVIVTGMSSLPYNHSSTARLKKIDRKMAYVAMTRAKERLYITAYKKEKFAEELMLLDDLITVQS